MGSSIDQFLARTGGQNTKPAGVGEKASDVDRWLVDPEVQARLGVGASTSARTDPAKAARVLRLQSKTGLPEDLINRNLDAIEADARKADFNPEVYARTSPIVSRWLAEHPEHVALASQDLTKLSYLERQIGNIKAQFGEGRHLSELQDIGEAAMLGTITPAQRRRQAELDAQARDPQRDYGITGFFEGIPGAIANQLPIFANTFFGKVKAAIFGGGAGALVQGGAAAGATAIAGQLGPQAATPEEVVTVPAAFVAGAAKGGLKGAGLGWKYGGAVAAGRMEAALAYLEFEKIRDEKGNPLDRTTMLGAAGIVGALNGALEMIGFESVAKSIPGLRSIGRQGLRDMLLRQTTRQAIQHVAKNVGEAMLTEGATEFMQDVVKNGAGELATMINDGSINTASPADVLARIFSQEHVAEAIADARAGAQGGGGMALGGGAMSMVSHFNNIKQAERRQQFFQAIGGELQDSEMLKNMPEKTQEVVERLTKDGPVENLYIPIEEWNTYWQGKNIDPAAAAEEVNGDRTGYEEAQETGGDITIKTARWAVTIAPSEHNKFFSEVMRLAPDEMNAKEAKALREELDQLDQKQTAEAAPSEQAGSAVQEAVANQLRATGKFTEPQIAAQAQLHGDIFRTLGQRTGQDPVALFQRFGLQINAQDAPETTEGLHQPVRPSEWNTVGRQANEVLEVINRTAKADDKDAGLADNERYALMQTLGAVEQQDVGRVKELFKNITDFPNLVRPDFMRRVERYAPALWEMIHRPETEFWQKQNDMLTGFRSKLESLIADKMPNKTSVEQARAVVSGAKVEEREWTGIDNFLNSLEPGSEVSKAQLLEYARQNRVHLERMNLAGTGMGFQEVQDVADSILEDMVTERVTEMMREAGEDPWGSEQARTATRQQLEGTDDYQQMIDDALEQAMDENGPPTEPGEGQYGDYTLPGGSNYTEEAVVMPENPFSHQHFNVQGIIAHLRRKTRQLAGGARILHIEEIQSDLHQAGREKGYETADEMKQLKTPLTPEEKARKDELARMPYDRRVGTGVQAEYEMFLDREELAAGDVSDLLKVPDAPLKKTWHELAFKAAVVQAVKDGQQLITWTTGQQQVDRYGEGLNEKQRAGLRGFYDDILVRYATKFAKAYGAKVNDIKIDLLEGAEDPDAVVTESLSHRRRVTMSPEDRVEWDRLKVAKANANQKYSQAMLKVADLEADIRELRHEYVSQGHSFRPTQEKLFNRVNEALNRALAEKKNFEFGAPGHVELMGGPDAMARYEQLLTMRQTMQQIYPTTNEDGQQHIWTTVHSMEITPEMARAVTANELDLYQMGKKGSPNRLDPIVAAASRTKTGEVFTGIHHGETEQKAADAGFDPAPEWFHEQGFVTKSGKFLDRREALHWLGYTDEDLATGEELGAEDGEVAEAISEHFNFNEHNQPTKDAYRVTWDVSFTPEEQRSLLKTAGLHEMTIEEAVGTKWDKLQPGVRALLEPLVFKEIPRRVHRGGEPITLGSVLKDALGLRQLPTGGSEEDVPRGRIRIGEHSMQIDLFKTSDLSTFLHESGHFYLQVLDELGQEFPALAEDREAVRTWLNIGDGPIPRESHETFARAFEAYLMTGEAPTSGLRGAFAKFRAWLLGVYRSVKSLNVEVSPELKRVFDRMIATDDELTASAQELSAAPMFLDMAQSGMTPSEASVYSQVVEDARQAAEASLTAKLMREVTRERTEQYKAAREVQRAQVIEETNNDRNWRAIALLTRGTLPDGSPLPENLEAFKLSKTALVAHYGKEVLVSLPRPHVYEVAAGLHPDVAADILGFRSGEELVRVLASTTESPKAYIERVTDQRTRAAFGELELSGKLPDEAMKAWHTDKRSLLLQKELQHLASTNLAALKGLVRKVARPLPSVEEVRAGAESTIAQKLVRDIRPIVYQRAEAKAGKNALESLLKGDVDRAFQWKQKQLLNAELYRAAVNAQERVDAIVEYMSKFNRQTIRDRLGKAGGSYLAQIDAIRSRFDFARNVTMKELTQREALRDFVQDQHALGFTIEIPEKVMNEAYRQHFKEISLDELEGINDAVRQIDHLARVKNRLLASSRARTLATAVAEITASIGATHTLTTTPPDFAPSFMARLKAQARGIIASHTKMEFLFEWLDGNKEQGPAWAHLFKPMVDAENAESVIMKKAVTAMRDIFKVYPINERATWFWNKIHIDGIQSPMTKANILAVALNQGNDYNKDALLRGYGWTQQQVDKILAHLDARDWQVVQGIWDHLESYWPQIAKLEKDLNGLEPQKVEASEVTTPFGTLRGGYYPIVFDSKLSWRQAVIESRNAVPELFGGQWARAMTRHGHTEARTNTGGKPLLLELSGLSEHIANVAHDLSHRRAVIDVNRIVQTPEVRNAIESSVGREMYKQIHPWLLNVAGAQRADYVNPIEGLLGRARMGATIANMGWKVTTGLAQFLSYTNTIKEIGPKYAMSGLNAIYSKPWKFRTQWNFVTSRSEFMKDRIESYDRDVHDALKRINIAGGKPGPLSVLQAYSTPVRDSFFMFVGLMDMGASLPTWMGAYSKAMDGAVAELAKGDEQAAIDYADKVVRQTQGVGAAKDLANVQTGSEIYKLFTMFYSYFNVLFNQFAKTTHEARLTKNIPRFVANMALLWFIPAALQELIVGRGPNADDDEDAWAKWITAQEVSYPFQTIVLLRDVINGMGRFGYEPSAAFDAFKQTSTAGKAIIGSVVDDNEFTRADAKATAAAVGYYFKLPTKQMWLTSEYFYDWLTGEEQPESAVEALWRSTVTGKKRETP